MNLLPLHHSSTVSCFGRGPKTPTPVLRTTTTTVSVSVSANATTIPARDRVIDFGKHKGKMLGTLSSDYLKWVSNNLRAREFEEWAKLADQVLSDPVYRDRIEWEFAQKLLNGDVPIAISSTGLTSRAVVSELLEISKRFGWDNEDKVGWSKIDFGFLGTSKGGRIPRIDSKHHHGVSGVERDLELGVKKKMKREKARVDCCEDGEEEVMGGRERRRERLRSKRQLLRSGDGRIVPVGLGGRKAGNNCDDDDCCYCEDDDNDDDTDRNGEVNRDRTAGTTNPFPGRDSLLKKVLNRSRLL